MDQQLAGLLQATLSPSSAERKGAERDLTALQARDDVQFGPLVLGLVASAQVHKTVRLAGALAFKNWVRQNWGLEDAPTPLTNTEAELLKSRIVSIMVTLSTEPGLQVQISEAISIMAEADFPEKWEGLVDQLVASLSATNFQVNNAVLATAHSIFKKWRPAFSSDELFLEIKFVLERFCEPYLQMFQQTHQLLQATPPPPAAETLVLLRTTLSLMQLYHDLNAQDLPDFFEERLQIFMPLLLSYLDYTPPSLAGTDADDEDEVGDLEKIKAEVCDIAALYTVRYLDAFTGETNEQAQAGGYLGPFVEKTWGLLTRLSSGVKYDILVARSTGFLGTVVRLPSQKTLFENPQTLETFVQNIVLPNMALREFEEEMFEDDAPEYVRRDLEVAGSETRRQAASDFVKALMEQFEGPITEIIGRYIGSYLQQYAESPATAWKSKDTAIFLLTSIASRGSTQQQGVTATNALVDVVKWFSDNVYADLRPEAQVHNVVRADAIKYLYTFRNQLTKEQLLSVLPILIPYLAHSSYVIHTYAAMTIERVLFIKQGGAFLFSQADIRPYADKILESAFGKIESGETPSQIAANDNLMKCVMRVILTARQTLTPIYATTLVHLTKILAEISKNPSNPKFNHFTFESISALIRFVTAGTPGTLLEFENSLFPIFQFILQADISDFTPFVFQILSQLLELHGPSDFPDAYKVLLPPLLTPTLWEHKGNVPALVRLLRAFLKRGLESIVANQQLNPILGIFQYLIQSRVNDVYGFELLEGLVETVPYATLQPFLSNPIFVLLLTRLQTNKTEKFTLGLAKFICFASASAQPGWGPDAVIAALDGCQPQPGLFAQVIPVLLPEVQKAPTKDRKTVAVGLAALLTQSQKMWTAPYSNNWTPVMTALLKLFLLSIPLSKNSADADEELANVDLDDQNGPGYQAAFSKLGASAQAPVDPVAHIADPRTFVAEGLVAANKPGAPGAGRVKGLIESCGPELAGPFLAFLQQGGYAL